MSESLADQLRPVRENLRAGRPEVKPVVQITCEVTGPDPLKAAVAARKRILDWLRDKQQVRAIPAGAWNGEPFEIDASEDRPTSCEAYDNLWALRYDNPDRREHGRQWRTEAIIGHLKERTLLGIRLTVISRTWDVPFIRSVPTVIHDLTDTPGLADYGVRLARIPRIVDNESDIDELVKLLELPSRTRPVYVVSVPADGQAPIDVAQLAQRTAGIAHVFQINPRASWELSTVVGNNLSVFGSAVRTYKPGFDRYDAHREEHRLATNEWLNRRFRNRWDFVDLLTSGAALDSVSLPDLEQRLPGFTKVRQELARRRINAARVEDTGATQMAQLYEEDNRRLQEDLDAAEDLIEAQSQQQRLVEEQRDQLARLNFNLRSRVEQLERARDEQKEIEDVEWPDSYDDIELWAARYLGGRLVILPRALRAVKKADFQDVAMAAKALYLLGHEYRGMKLGEVPREIFERTRLGLGLELSSSGNEPTLRQWAEEYEVTWGKERRFLEMHLKRGTSRETKNCLRVYFFWDEDSEQVVVGHLPSHLTNEAT